MTSSETKPALETRRLGRTGRMVTTLGLGGQAALMLTPPGVDAPAIVTAALALGLTYFDTSNAYGPSQANYGLAFRPWGLTPGTANYDPAARRRIYLASKTHMRTSRHPEGRQYRTDFSNGQTDIFKVTTAQDDVRRSLSLIFGDGVGGYPEGAYLDCIQIHDLSAQDDVEMIYTGFYDPGAASPWLGALAGLLDLRDGTNRSGTNPKLEKLVNHIGITGHYNPAAHIAAIQRDEYRILDTLLVAINPTDRHFFSHRYNSVPVAHAAGMGVIAMKVFVDASYYGEPPTFQRTPDHVYRAVGEKPVASDKLIRYAMSVEGVTCCVTGIGDNAGSGKKKSQLESNLAAAQMTAPMDPREMIEIENRLSAAGLGTVNSYLQRCAIGLTAPRNAGAEGDPAGFTPATPLPRPAIRITWDTAYAGAAHISHYEVIRDGAVIATVPHKPQTRQDRFFYEDVFPPPEAETAAQSTRPKEWTAQRAAHEEQPHREAVGTHSYVVRAVDKDGNRAETEAMTAAS